MEGILRSYFREQAEQEAWLERKHPWVPILRNWALLVLVVILFFGFGKWGFDIHVRMKQEEARASLKAEIAAAEQAAAEDAKKLEEDAAKADAELQIREAKAIARMLFGIRNFTQQYHYTEADLRTYAQCAVNRALATGKGIEEVLAEKGQFIAYSEHNNLETDLYNLALAFIADLHAGKLPECDTRFRYAVMKDTGIWLVDDPLKANPERWHA